jgi:prophage DNA circulation protein
MMNVYREIYGLQYDLKVLISQTERYRDDADRGINVSFTSKAENEPKEKQVERLVSYLIDAKHDLDRLRDDLKGVLDNLVKLVDIVEYETVAEGIRK